MQGKSASPEGQETLAVLAAALFIEGVRKQFRRPGVLEGTTKPNYGRVVRTILTLRQRSAWAQC